MLCRQRGGRRRALSSVWRSVSNVGTPSGRLGPNGNSVLRRRGARPYHILVLAITRLSGVTVVARPYGVGGMPVAPSLIRRELNMTALQGWIVIGLLVLIVIGIVGLGAEIQALPYLWRTHDVGLLNPST